MAAAETRIRHVSVAEISLDRENPRLPEELRGAPPEDILRYLFDESTLVELAQSFVDNGFFEHEPLLIEPRTGGYVALEGNRRLAALKILLGQPEAAAVGLEFDLDPAPNASQLARLQEVACLIVSGREEVRRYLGFRHIGGIKTWSAEAKARYIADEVRHERESGTELDAVFRVVARRVGSNTQGVRNSYIAISVLRAARTDFEIPTEHVQHRRFGVWLRAMNSPELRVYIGLGSPKSLEAIEESLTHLVREPLAEVLGDMSPRTNGKPVLADSRDVTTYALILENTRAHETLRKWDNFDLARQIVEQAALADRVRQVSRTVEVVIDEVSRADEPPSDLRDAAQELHNLSRTLVAIAGTNV